MTKLTDSSRLMSSSGSPSTAMMSARRLVGRRVAHGRALVAAARVHRCRSLCSRAGEKYERLTPVDHVLRRPGMYIGSTSVQVEPLWLLERDGNMVFREAQYVPGLYKIFDEILVNALDNRQRDAAPLCQRVGDHHQDRRSRCRQQHCRRDKKGDVEFECHLRPVSWQAL